MSTIQTNNIINSGHRDGNKNIFVLLYIYAHRRTFNWTIKSINIFPFYQTLNNQNNENSINKSINKLSLHPD